MPHLPALILRRSDRVPSTGARFGPEAAVPSPRLAADDGRPALVIRRGADALRLLDIAPPHTGLSRGSLLLGFAMGAVVASRRRSR